MMMMMYSFAVILYSAVAESVDLCVCVCVCTHSFHHEDLFASGNSVFTKFLGKTKKPSLQSIGKCWIFGGKHTLPLACAWREWNEMKWMNDLRSHTRRIWVSRTLNNNNKQQQQEACCFYNQFFCLEIRKIFCSALLLESWERESGREKYATSSSLFSFPSLGAKVAQESRVSCLHTTCKSPFVCFT